MLTDRGQDLMTSVNCPIKKFDPLPIPFQSAPIANGIRKNRHPIDQHLHDLMPIFGRVPLIVIIIS